MSLNPGRSIEALVKVTSIGVERQKPAELLSKLLPTEADLFAAIPQSDAAAFTLTALAILDAYASAGFVAPMAKNKLPSAAEPEAESSSGVSPALAAALREALSLQSPALLREALQQMALRGKRIPAELLADVMQQALQQESIIESLRPCLGARGRWLSELNPQWQALVSAGPQASDVEWQEGTLAQRCEYFRVLRQQDAERSRAVWQSDVQALPAKERLALKI
jgi:hypothetical protein